jgi:hypothetical protein
MIDRRVDLYHSGKVWMVLAGLVVAGYILWQISNSIAAGSYTGAILIGAVFVAFFVGGRIADDWRQGVYFFIGWLLFEDLIRKYLGNSMYIYFTKDVLVGVTYGAFLTTRKREERRQPFHPPFRLALGAFVLLGFAQVFNPLSPSIFYGLLGLKLYFYYAPLMFVGYAMMRSEDDLRRFMVTSMIFAGVISIVGIVQAIVGLDFLNPHSGSDIEQLGHLSRMTHSGIEVPRPPAVFVSEGRFTEYLVLAFILALGTAGYLLLRPGRGRKIVFSAVALVSLAATLSGGRGAFMQVAGFSLLLSALILWGAPPDLASAYRLFKAISRSFILVAVLVSLSLMIFPNVIGARLAFYQESALPGSEYSEVGTRMWSYPVEELGRALDDPVYLTGHGIGTASLGMQYVSRILEVPPSTLGVESGFGELILELGILGPILWLLWTGSLVFAGFKVAMQVKGTWAFPVAISILSFAFLLLFISIWGGFVPYQNFVNNAYFWLLTGILFKLPVLVKQDPGALRGSSA